MSNAITFILDGNIRTLTFGPGSPVTPTTTVLEYLRSLPGHTGTKEGCAEGDCGACTVVIAEPEGDRLRYAPVDSCLMLLPMLHGRQLITVENLREPDTRLHPVQEAMVEFHGSQCGFCTPGIVMSLFALSRRGGPGAGGGVRTALAGNLCRCTGYRPIIDAAHAIPPPDQQDHFRQQEADVLRRLREIRRASIRLDSPRTVYHRPADLSEALKLRAAHPDAVIVNGATDVALRLTKLHQEIPLILDLSGVDELRRVDDTREGLTFGSGVTISRIHDLSKGRYPAIADYTSLFGSLQIRSMATIGGNIGTASPVGDSLPVLMAHDAEIELMSTHGTRRVAASAFATGYRKTACAPVELITAVRIVRPERGTTIRWYKVSRRRDVDIATVSAAFRLTRDSGGRVERIVLAYGGMADRTRRAARAEEFLQGRSWDRNSVEQAMAVIDGDFTPLSDVRGSAAFRRAAARNLLLKFWSDTHASGVPA
jgi:xanthine dehydrogenase small subunit